MTEIRRVGTYEYPDSSFSILPFHQAHGGTHVRVPLAVIGGNLDCDLITICLVRFNYNSASRLLSPSQDVDGTRIQRNAER